MEFQQHYPTYNFKERDIVLSEFEEAQKIANTQSKLYSQLANLLIAFITIGITILVKASDTSSQKVIEIAKENIIIFNCFLLIIGLVILRHFIELQRTIVINCRKVITLRKMLGLDYGNLQLTLPNWRVEGATNPFSVKLFPGWLRFGSSPFWIITISLNIFWYLTHSLVEITLLNKYWYFINILITIAYALIYRIQLNETHETFYLSLVKWTSRVLKIKLLENFEYILYRTKLAVYEKNRLKYNTEILSKILIEIEDSRFYKHRGVDYKSLIRSILSVNTRYRKKNGFLKSGGSTITMQLCRTLFIPSNQNTLRRKIIEILLSSWFEKQFKKTEILDIYLTSVRFERNINGIISATNHFFKAKTEKEYSYEEAFLLIERLSNISSTYRVIRIESILERIPSKKNISKEKLFNLYKKIEHKNLVKLK